ncbi:hypothetical protein F66182_18639, partial [Fusarium sp. NRRL 66182]
KRELAVREAKQYVQDVVRTDWSFEPPSNLWTVSSYADLPMPAVAAAAASVVAQTSTEAQPGLESRQPNIAQGRIREPASSESDSDLDPALRRAIESHKSRKGDPYRFESPDAIKTSVLERGRRRRADLEQEMMWNPGLRFYVERRDAWTGARKRRDVEQRATKRQQALINILSRELSNSKIVDLNGNADENVGSLQNSTSSAQQSRDLLEDLSLSEKKSRDTTSTTDNNTSNEDYGLDGSTGDDGDIEDDNDDRSFDPDESLIPVMDSFI